nr:hypothetical protein [Micromonospora sp. DSM 115978]
MARNSPVSGGGPAEGEPTGQQRANRFMLVLLALQRLSCLVPAAASLTSPVYHSTWLNAGLLAVAVAWNLLLFWRSAVRGWFPPALVCLDVVLTLAMLPLVGANLPVGAAGPATHWADGLGEGAAALTAAAIGRAGWAVTGVAALVIAQAAVIGSRGAGTGDPLLELLHAVNGLVCFAGAASFGLRYLRREGDRLDRSHRRRLAAQSALAAEQARHATRLAHHRALHDTVLTTLTVIARGGADAGAEQIRRRCAHEAAYLRRLLADEGHAEAGTVGGALHEVVGAAELLGLRVHFRSDQLPADLPARAVDALRDASREALNNVVKHAGVDEAWVTATWESEVLRVTVVDRGGGFTPDPAPPGSGIRRSIMEPMTAAGGRVRISTEPGAGTCVELSWAG